MEVALREADRRTRCEANLQLIRDALHHYAAANKFQYPRVVYDAANLPNSYTCFTGPDESNPFAAGSAAAWSMRSTLAVSRSFAT